MGSFAARYEIDDCVCLDGACKEGQQPKNAEGPTPDVSRLGWNSYDDDNVNDDDDDDDDDEDNDDDDDDDDDEDNNNNIDFNKDNK